jgi:hypothetical protein
MLRVIMLIVSRMIVNKLIVVMLSGVAPFFLYFCISPSLLAYQEQRRKLQNCFTKVILDLV